MGDDDEAAAKSLGWRISATSQMPQVPTIKGLLPGGWAEKQGVREGDEIAQLNGHTLQDHTPPQILEALKERPLRIRLCRRTKPTTSGTGPIPLSPSAVSLSPLSPVSLR